MNASPRAGTVVRWTSQCVATVGFLAAAWHVAALLISSFAAHNYPVGYPAWRHGAFIAINPAFGWLFLSRPYWLIWPYTPLVMQILAGHGANVVNLWRRGARMDWISVLVVAIALLGLIPAVCLWRDRHRR